MVGTGASVVGGGGGGASDVGGGASVTIAGGGAWRVTIRVCGARGAGAGAVGGGTAAVVVGGSKVVTVPESAPVVTFAPATRADLTAGKKIFVLTTPTKRGIFEAHVLLVEKDGVVPPI